MTLSVISSLLVAVMVGLFGEGVAVSKSLKTNVPADVSQEEIKAVVLEDFFDASKDTSPQPGKGWFVYTTPRKLSDETRTNSKGQKILNPVLKIEYDIIDGFPNDLAAEKYSITKKGTADRAKKCLGVKFQFRYPGPNEVHILPPGEVNWEPAEREKQDPSKATERSLILPGRAKEISCWVHSRGKPYTLEVWVKDYKNSTYILKMGSLDFVGWRPMMAKIPGFMPQATESYPQTRSAKIVRFVIKANTRAPKEELMEETYVFFTQIKVLTEMFEVNFDGNDLHNKLNGEKGSSDKGKKAGEN